MGRQSAGIGASRLREVFALVRFFGARFGPGEPRLYGTWVAYNLRAGTVFRTQWYRDDELVFTDAWTAPRDGEQLCIWFYVTPQDVEFLPGRWQIRLFADEINAATPIEFLIEGDTMEG